MSTFEKNMAVLHRRYPALAAAVISDAADGYRLVPSADQNLPNLLHVGGDEHIFFYEPADPLAHVKAVLTDLRLEQALVVVLLGLGLGYHLNVLFSALRTSDPLRKIIVVEKDISCFRLAMEVLDISEPLAHEQVKLLVGSKKENLYLDMWNLISPEFGALKAIKFVPWPASINLAPDYYLDVKGACKDVARSFLGERGNDPYDTLVAYENFFENLPQYLANPGVNQVSGLFRGRPAVVVAAGPSLNKNVHLLKTLEKRAVILCADASLKIVYENDILPHFVTTVERTPGTDKFFHGVTGLEQTTLAVASFTYPQTLAAFTGPLLFAHRKYDLFRTLGVADDCFEMGGTTAHCAFALAEHMECNPIIFIGQDLAYGTDGVTHAKGCTFGERQTYANEAEKIEVPANMGGFVQTCPLWLRLLREYERTLDRFDGLAVNATEGGARIRGTQLMTFRDAISEYCREEFDPRETIIRHLQSKRSSATPAMILDRLEGLVPEVEEVLDASREIIQQVFPVLRLVEGIEGDIPADLGERIHQTSRELNRSADQLMSAPLFKSAGEYFMSVWVPLLLEWQVVAERFKERTWAEAYRLRLGEEAFGVMGQLCLSLLDVIEKGKEKIRGL